MEYSFEGFLRKDGSVGTRNYIGVVCSVICSSMAAREISDQVPEAVPIVHSNGCAQLGDDFSVTKNMLVGAASNPNFHSALLVGLGCETNQISGLLESIPTIKPIKGIGIQQLSGAKNTIKTGVEIAKGWSLEASKNKRQKQPLSSLTVGVVTVDIDEETLTQAVPVVSGVVETLIENGATVIMGLTETLEPASHLLAERTSSKEAKEKLVKLGDGLYRKRWKEVSNTVRKNQGYTEVETSLARLEAALSGTNHIQSVLQYSERPTATGLHLTKASSNVVETLSNMTSSGCNIAFVISSRGILTGSIALPCMTISAKRSDGLFDEMVDYLVTEDDRSQQVEAMLQELMEISSGKQTNLEKHELGEFSIPHVGTTF